MYTIENHRAGSVEHLSPSGQYSLVVTQYASKEGCWDVTLGKVYKVGKEEPLFEVRRNHYGFPFSWLESHSNGHDYLVCGSDYLSQTVLELDTGKLKDSVPGKYSFCWVDYKLNREHNILVVAGCFWACPYEFKFFDFSDPMKGWAEIKPEEYVDFDDREPHFNEDGTITCYQSEYEEDDEEIADDVKVVKQRSYLASSKTFRREELSLHLVNEWISPKEQRTRELREKSQQEYDEWLTNFIESDALYLAMQQGITDPMLSTKEAYDSIGVTFDSWCPGFTAQERRIIRRILNQKDCGGFTIDLEWGCETSPIKLVIYKKGKHVEDKFFREHSVHSIKEALDYAKSLVLSTTNTIF